MTMRLPAIVPAAGSSRRMGRPKLTLLLPDGSTVIGHLLDALTNGGAGPVVVVGPVRGAPGWQALSDACERPDVRFCIPDVQPAEMRESVAIGLATLDPDDPGFLLAPADSIGITSGLVERVLERFLADPSRLVVPTHMGERGHPVAFPRDLIPELLALPAGVGLNALRERRADRVALLEVPESGTLTDLDTPGDLDRWLRAGDAV